VDAFNTFQQAVAAVSDGDLSDEDLEELLVAGAEILADRLAGKLARGSGKKISRSHLINGTAPKCLLYFGGVLYSSYGWT